MTCPAIHDDPVTDLERLAEIADLDLFSAQAQSRLDEFARQAAARFDLPIGLVTVVLDGAQCFAGKYGVAEWMNETQGTPVEWTEERTYFFRLSAYQDRLLKLYADNPGFIRPETRRNEVVSFVRSGLQDLSISRTSLTWGVPVPDAPGHVMYVWVDALTNYVTGAGFPDTADPRWRYWPADVHIIGKDIVRFHAVYWPAFLISAGLELPKRVFGHGFLFNRGEKMSKSVGNVIDPFTLADHYGVDQLRYFFLREVPFGQDGNYSHEASVTRVNADLANDLGNLAQRSLTMVARQFGGKLAKPGAFSEADTAILAAAAFHFSPKAAAEASSAPSGNASRSRSMRRSLWASSRTGSGRHRRMDRVTGRGVERLSPAIARSLLQTSAGRDVDGVRAPSTSRLAVASHPRQCIPTLWMSTRPGSVREKRARSVIPR